MSLPSSRIPGLFVLVCALLSAAPAWADSEDFTFIEAGFAMNARGLSPFPPGANDSSWHVPFGKFLGTKDGLAVEIGGLGAVTGPLEGIFGFSNVAAPGRGWVEGINFGVAFNLVKPFLYVGLQLRFDHLRVAMNTPMTNVCGCLWATGAIPLGVPWAALTYEGHFGTGLFIGNGLIGGGSAALHVTPIAGFLGAYVRYGVTAFRNSPSAGQPFLGSVSEVGISVGGFGMSGLGD